jgi:acyl-coenzyme A thioesterase PaaI-like protein
MKTLITEFISLDAVVQAPGGANEDTDGGFAHGGWSMKYFDPVVMYGTYTTAGGGAQRRARAR